jgi:hypothetical protein
MIDLITIIDRIGSINKKTDEEYSKLGLAYNHVYSVLGAKIRDGQPFVSRTP